MPDTLSWKIHKINLPLKFDWKISRNKSESKTNFIVEVESGKSLGFGEVAFNVRYGESEELIEERFANYSERLLQGGFEQTLQNLDELKNTDAPRSLLFALESAYFHCVAFQKGQTVSSLFDLKRVESVKTSFSLPIMEIAEIAPFIEHHQLQRFEVLKVKVGKNPIETVREVAKHYKGPLRVDANEAWTTADEVLQFENEIGEVPIEFLEQPLPADKVDEAIKLKKSTRHLLMADESMTDHDVTADYADRFHGVNVKLMKSGGYRQALKQLQQARQLGLKTMLGCMVETSLGIASAMHIAEGVDYFDLDGCLLLDQDPYQFVAEEKGYLRWLSHSQTN